jgi:hypothetical protein
MIDLTDKAPEYKASSARALWFAAVSKCAGKSPEEFVEAATKTPPALKKDGKAEHPAGWLTVHDGVDCYRDSTVQNPVSTTIAPIIPQPT